MLNLRATRTMVIVRVAKPNPEYHGSLLYSVKCYAGVGFCVSSLLMYFVSIYACSTLQCKTNGWHVDTRSIVRLNIEICDVKYAIFKHIRHWFVHVSC